MCEYAALELDSMVTLFVGLGARVLIVVVFSLPLHPGACFTSLCDAGATSTWCATSHVVGLGVGV